jgi:hypothetical protein
MKIHPVGVALIVTKGTGIVQAFPLGQVNVPVSFGGTHIRYIVALKDRATSPQAGLILYAGESAATSLGMVGFELDVVT